MPHNTTRYFPEACSRVTPPARIYINILKAFAADGEDIVRITEVAKHAAPLLIVRFRLPRVESRIVIRQHLWRSSDITSFLGYRDYTSETG